MVPTIFELTKLFEGIPKQDPPAPRQRPQPLTRLPPSAPPPPASFFGRMWNPVPKDSLTPQPRKPNAFQALKAGNKTVVIAVVDAGTTSFYRFGEGIFGQWEMG